MSGASRRTITVRVSRRAAAAGPERPPTRFGSEIYNLVPREPDSLLAAGTVISCVS